MGRGTLFSCVITCIISWCLMFYYLAPELFRDTRQEFLKALPEIYSSSTLRTCRSNSFILNGLLTKPLCPHFDGFFCGGVSR